MKIGEREPAPRRAQHGKPRRAIGEMGERARESVEILHHLFFAQPLDLDRAVTDPGLFQRRHDMIKVASIAH